MTHREPILDPTGQAAATRTVTLAPRPGDLTGLKVGLLENTKPNARLVLETVARRLRTRHELGAVTSYTKAYFGTPAEDEQVRRIAHECDLVLTGVGD